jgi:hypothetical protein
MSNSTRPVTPKKNAAHLGLRLNPHQRRRVEETPLGSKADLDPTEMDYPHSNAPQQAFFVRCSKNLLINA